MVNGCGGEDALENGHEDAARNDAGTKAEEAEGNLEPDPVQYQDQDQETTSLVDVGVETKKPKTTTIGTIALQSGNTRLVIALLEVRLKRGFFFFFYNLVMKNCWVGNRVV